MITTKRWSRRGGARGVHRPRLAVVGSDVPRTDQMITVDIRIMLAATFIGSCALWATVGSIGHHTPSDPDTMQQSYPIHKTYSYSPQGMQ